MVPRAEDKYSRKTDLKGVCTWLEKARVAYQIAEKFTGLPRPEVVWICWANNREGGRGEPGSLP